MSCRHFPLFYGDVWFAYIHNVALTMQFDICSFCIIFKLIIKFLLQPMELWVKTRYEYFLSKKVSINQFLAALRKPDILNLLHYCCKPAWAQFLLYCKELLGSDCKRKCVHTCDTGAQNPSLVVLGFLILSDSTLHLLQNTFYRIKISCF